MRMRHAAVVAGLALGLMSTAAQAVYIVDIEQVNGNVVATGSGSINFSGLGYELTTVVQGSIQPLASNLLIGSGLADVYGGDVTGPDNFGSGNAAVADSNDGPLVGLSTNFNNLSVLVPHGYKSGDPLGVSTSIFDNQTFASLGLTAGSYTYFIPTNGAEGFPDTFTINIGVSAVPLPASASMFGAALLALGAVGCGLKRKKAAATV